MVTENLFLSNIEEDDKKHLYSWFQDSEFLRFYDYYPPVPQSKDDVDNNMKYYENNEKSFIFAVKLKESGQLIGVAGYDDIIKENKVATLFIGIGNTDLRGKGYGREALKLLLDYGFNKMDFHRIQLNVLSFNERAIALYEKSGFVKEGTYREFVLRDNVRYDLYLYGLLKNEWFNK